MEEWKDGRVEGWKDGWLEGWMNRGTATRAWRSGILPFFHSSILQSFHSSILPFFHCPLPRAPLRVIGKVAKNVCRDFLNQLFRLLRRQINVGSTPAAPDNRFATRVNDVDH
jgi:hypothetical protein